MTSPKDRKVLLTYVALLAPVAWLASLYDPYRIDGDAVSYMDISDLIQSHEWAGVVNGYWHPLYPALLAVSRGVVRTTRFTELHAYYLLNFGIFLGSVAAMLFFISALEKLRRRSMPVAAQDGEGTPLLSLPALRLLGLGLLVVAAQRELSPGRIRPDALLQMLLLAAFGALLQALASDSLLFPALMGLLLGLAYLTKSLAFLVSLLTIATMVLFQVWVQRRKAVRVATAGVVALLTFAVIAGPYMAALSRQKHRLDFGDSGALNFAWLSAGTEKMHLEPWMTDSFGGSSVKLVHPERQLLASPGVYNYAAERYGTYPPWFDTTFFNERVVPHVKLRLLLPRIARNLVLCTRYFFNHPEGWVLLGLLVWIGARFQLGSRKEERFWVPVVGLGLAITAIYALVLIEERYVTFAYLCIVLPAFATLSIQKRPKQPASGPWLPFCASALVALMAFTALAEWLRTSLEARRDQSVAGLAHGWSNPQIFGAAEGLRAMGVQTGDAIACVGTTACLYDPYWARLAGVRVLTEIYEPESEHLIKQLQALPNLPTVYDTVRSQGARVLVGNFDPGEMNAENGASAGWVRLGETNFYALPLTSEGRPTQR